MRGEYQLRVVRVALLRIENLDDSLGKSRWRVPSRKISTFVCKKILWKIV